MISKIKAKQMKKGDIHTFTANKTKVVKIRGYFVMLASDVAKAFEVETRRITQNVKNNPTLFKEKYAFQVISKELDYLRSLGMISKPGRGGSRELPWVITRKGAIRLASIMKSKRAIEAADIFVDVFDEVLFKLRNNQKIIDLSNPSRIAPSDSDITEAKKLRTKIFQSINELLQTVIDPVKHTTVQDELKGAAIDAIDYVREFLRTKKYENEKVQAETILILEQARDIYERRLSELADAKIARESKALENLLKKIEIVQKLWDMYNKIEPNAVIGIIGEYNEDNLLPTKKTLLLGQNINSRKVRKK
jgi:hypothetical protein